MPEPDEEERKAEEKQAQLQKINLLQLQQSDSTTQFTDGVNKLIKN